MKHFLTNEFTFQPWKIFTRKIIESLRNFKEIASRKCGKCKHIIFWGGGGGYISIQIYGKFTKLFW